MPRFADNWHTPFMLPRCWRSTALSDLFENLMGPAHASLCGELAHPFYVTSLLAQHGLK